jgi:kynureninase
MPDPGSTTIQATAAIRADFRQQFVITDPHLIYLDGNLPGRLPKATPARLQQVTLDEWGSGLIRGWNDNWFDTPVLAT